MVRLGLRNEVSTLSPRRLQARCQVAVPIALRLGAAVTTRFAGHGGETAAPCARGAGPAAGTASGHRKSRVGENGPERDLASADLDGGTAASRSWDHWARAIRELALALRIELGAIGPDTPAKDASTIAERMQTAHDVDPAKLRRFLDAYWLRPENALWMTLRSDALDKITWSEPAIDIACGDGVFSFLHHGGSFDPDFDVFHAVASLDRVYEQHADMFDAIDPTYAPTIEARPATRINTGMDLKAALLSKAAALRFYERIVRHDANQPLPLQTDACQTVYCNAAYWVENLSGLLRELNRITLPGGTIILQVKLDSIRECTLEPIRAVLGARFLDIIGRGRFETWPSLLSRSAWEESFRRAGLQIVDVAPVATKTHAHLWDVGLRPIAPLLVRMAKGLSSSDRSSIKRDWVDLFVELATPLRQFDLALSAPDSAEPVELQYHLTPR